MCVCVCVCEKSVFIQFVGSQSCRRLPYIHNLTKVDLHLCVKSVRRVFAGIAVG